MITYRYYIRCKKCGGSSTAMYQDLSARNEKGIKSQVEEKIFCHSGFGWELEDFMQVCISCGSIDETEIVRTMLKKIEPDTCEHMTLDDFISSVKSGLFTDDDGHGKYATKNMVSDILVDLGGKARREWTHVCWYNK